MRLIKVKSAFFDSDIFTDHLFARAKAGTCPGYRGIKLTDLRGVADLEQEHRAGEFTKKCAGASTLLPERRLVEAPLRTPLENGYSLRCLVARGRDSNP